MRTIYLSLMTIALLATIFAPNAIAQKSAAEVSTQSLSASSEKSSTIAHTQLIENSMSEAATTQSTVAAAEQRYENLESPVDLLALVANHHSGNIRTYAGCFVTRKSNLVPPDAPVVDVWHLYQAQLSQVRNNSSVPMLLAQGC